MEVVFVGDGSGGSSGGGAYTKGDGGGIGRFSFAGGAVLGLVGFLVAAFGSCIS